MFAWALKLLTGGVLDKLLAIYSNKTDKDAQIAVAHIQAELETRKLQKDLILADGSWWGTRWIRPLIVYPFILHVGAITLDSTFTLGWGIAKLPSPYESLELMVITSYFIARPFEKFGSGLLDIFRKKQ